MTRLKLDLIVWMCRSLDRADLISGLGERVDDRPDSSTGEVEVAERGDTGEGAVADTVAPVGERPDAIDEPTVDKAARATERWSRRDDETRTGLRAIISFSICCAAWSNPARTTLSRTRAEAITSRAEEGRTARDGAVALRRMGRMGEYGECSYNGVGEA